MKLKVVKLLTILMAINFNPEKLLSQEETPSYLFDRGTGMATSMLGSYVRKGEFLIYPFFESYYDHNQEYEPADFGYGSTTEYRGRGRAYEGLIFLSYGFTEKFSAEFEVAMIQAWLEKSPSDVSAMPTRIDESGLGDVEGQIRYRWNRENEKTPEFFNYLETVFPTGEDHSLIGTSVWEFKLGGGLVKGYKWGTVTARVGVEFSTDGNGSFGLGEYAVEYLKKMNDQFRAFVMIEGTQDEVALVPEIQWHFWSHAYLKANIGLGLTSKSTDYAPEIGVMFSL